MPAFEGSNQTSPVCNDSTAIQHILSDALEAFKLALTVSARSQQTIELYQRSIRPLIVFLGDRSISDISPGDLRAYLADLGYKVNRVTVGIRWQSIRAFFNWLYQEGWLQESPVKRIQAPKAPHQFPYVLSEPQALVRTAKAKAGIWVGYRNYAIVLTILDCGLRVSEAGGLMISDLDALHGMLRVTGKGSRQRRVYENRA